jgi:hypothetical protein
MGHYRGEMGFEEEHAREARRKETIRTRTAAKIKTAIEEEGIEFVLADILLNTTMAKINYIDHSG